MLRRWMAVCNIAVRTGPCSLPNLACCERKVELHAKLCLPPYTADACVAVTAQRASCTYATLCFSAADVDEASTLGHAAKVIGCASSTSPQNRAPSVESAIGLPCLFDVQPCLVLDFPQASSPLRSACTATQAEHVAAAPVAHTPIQQAQHVLQDHNARVHISVGGDPTPARWRESEPRRRAAAAAPPPRRRAACGRSACGTRPH